MVGGSREGYLEVLDIFSRDAAQRLEVLRKTPTGDELHLFTTHVHALKSAAASIGAAGVSQQAANLEIAGRNKDLKAIEAQLGAFSEALVALVRNLRAGLRLDEGPGSEEGEGGEGPPAVRDSLEQLRQALEDEEIRPIDALLKKLRLMDLTPALRHTIAAIADCVLVSEFRQAIGIIDGLPR
jgi:HPt (histidine-containing phosphotransfer) domain-containing protein